MKRAEEMAKVYYTVFSSPLGMIFLASTEKGVCRLEIGGDEAAFVRELKERFGNEVFRDYWFKTKAICQVEEYLAGERREFRLPLDIRGTEFQRKVWKAMRQIPYGQVKSYGELARQAGHPGAARAVGSACGANPLPIIVPCHRVVGSHGLGGYGYGLKLKKWLLRLEARNYKEIERVEKA